MQPKRSKNLIFVWILIGLGLLTILWFLFAKPSSIPVKIVVIPSDSKLTIDGKPAEPGDTTLVEGKHTLKVSREFFGDGIKEVDTADLEQDEIIYVLADANTEEARKYLAEHPEEQLLYEQATGAAFSATQENILKNYPIVTQLPYETLDYKVNYEVKENKSIYFTVTLYPVATTPGTPEYKKQLQGFRNDALSYLRENGVDIKTASIVFSPDPDKL
jgi:hypothetical protein